MATPDVAAETGPTPQLTPTLATGVDPTALATAVTPQAFQALSAVQPGATVNVQLGRPWGQFELHKGSRLVFLGSWRLLVANGGVYSAVVDVVREGDSYKMASIGSAQFISKMAELEEMPAVSAALDRGQAGFLRRTTDGGDTLLAYQADPAAGAGQGTIRVQPLFGPSRRFPGIDAGVGGEPELSLDEIDPLLPAE